MLLNLAIGGVLIRSWATYSIFKLKVEACREELHSTYDQELLALFSAC